jgi:hypothetical protein
MTATNDLDRSATERLDMFEAFVKVGLDEYHLTRYEEKISVLDGSIYALFLGSSQRRKVRLQNLGRG